jgi:hypothetical protein
MNHIYNEQENIEVKETTGKGKSLFAKRNFKKDDIVFVVTGEIVNYATDYTIPISENLKIEPRIPGGLSQFINHSCEPNVGIRNRTLLVAMRDIEQGEEILTSYAFLGYEYGHEKTIDGKEKKGLNLTCNCGTKSCNGQLQSYKEMSREWREKYKEYISDYLLDETNYP